MQNAEEADLGAKMLRIGGDLEEGLGHSSEQQVVQFGFVLQDERVQFMRQGEHHMEVARRQQFLLLGRRSSAGVLESDTLDSGGSGTSYRRCPCRRHIAGSMSI